MMTFEQINALEEEQARAWFSQTCASTKWSESIVAKRPFSSIDDIKLCAKRAWATMQEADFLEAFLAHPMIGDVNTLREKFASTKAIASNEQSGTAEASEAVLQELSDLNHQYLDKNGFIFIICATGLSAQTMLDALKVRISNDKQTELAIAAQEQIKITLLRIEKATQSGDE